MRCGVYVRVSTDDQRDNGYSIDSQLRMIKEYCEKNEYDIVDVYNDAGHSGKDLMRPEMQRLLKDIKSKKEYFNGKDAFIKDDFIFIKDEKIININDIKIKGQHNYENIMAALLVINEFEINKDIIKDFFMNFNGVEHRIEFVCQKDNLKFYNDSKATNPTSTITALDSFNEDIYLILGGMQRNQNFHELDNHLKNVKKIYAIGQVTDEVFDYAKEVNINSEKCYTLSKAMDMIKNDNLNNGVVLLSPASASWDQYDKFETRGEEFAGLAFEECFY